MVSAPRRLHSSRTGQTRDERGNMMGKIRVIFLRSHLRSMVKAVIQIGFLCAYLNALPRNRHIILYLLALPV